VQVFARCWAFPSSAKVFPLGAMMLMRKTVKPFTAKQIELATTFADQAVICHRETSGLFDEVQKTHGRTARNLSNTSRQRAKVA